jgi:hypothetical protein
MRHGRVGRVILIGLLIAVAASCGSPAWADDVARSLRTTEDDAIRIVRQVAEGSGTAEDDVARVAVRYGDELTQVRPRLLDYLDDLQQRLDQGDSAWEDIIFGVYCEATAKARMGIAPDAESVYRSAANGWSVAIADVLWNAGWVEHVVTLVEVALAEDPEGVQTALSEALYCIGRSP